MCTHTHMHMCAHTHTEALYHFDDVHQQYYIFSLSSRKSKPNFKSPEKPQFIPLLFSLGFCYSCGLSTTTIGYSCPSVCVSVCVCACVHDNSKNNVSIHLKLEHIVVYENSSDEFNIGHGPIKVKVTT